MSQRSAQGRHRFLRRTGSAPLEKDNIRRSGILLVLLVGGCGLGPALEIPLSQPEPTPNYRQLVADSAEVLKFGGSQGFLEISPLQPAKSLQPGDWMACVRNTAEGRSEYFSFFFKGHRIDAARRAVEYDHCEDEAFGALPRPTPSKPAKY